METKIVEITHDLCAKKTFYMIGEGSSSSDETESSSASVSSGTTPPAESNVHKYVDPDPNISYKTALRQDRSSNNKSANGLDRSVSDILGRTFITGIDSIFVLI